MTLLTARDIQNLLDIDTSTVYRMAGDGRLPAVKVGRQWRFPAESIEAMFSLRTAAGTGVDAAVAGDLVAIVGEALGLMMVVTDVAGTPLTPVVRPVPRLASRLDEAFDQALAECAVEWRVLGEDPDVVPRFVEGRLGFECARAFIRSGSALVGMVLAGGVAPVGCDDPDLYHLDADRRRLVLDLLPRVAAFISRMGIDRR